MTEYEIKQENTQELSTNSKDTLQDTKTHRRHRKEKRERKEQKSPKDHPKTNKKKREKAEYVESYQATTEQFTNAGEVLSNNSSPCDCPAHVHDRESPLKITEVRLKEKFLFCS